MAIVPNLGIPGYPVDQKLCSENRTFANLAAVLAATPLYPGEIVLALDTGQRFMGTALIAGRWGTVTGSIPTSHGYSGTLTVAGS
jgi:hypothetical protein